MELEQAGEQTVFAGPTSYLREAERLLVALRDIGCQPVLVTQFAPITDSDLQWLTRSFGQRLGGSPPPIVGSFDEIWKQGFCPDAIVTFAFPTDLRSIEHETRHLIEAELGSLAGDQEWLLVDQLTREEQLRQKQEAVVRRGSLLIASHWHAPPCLYWVRQQRLLN